MGTTAHKPVLLEEIVAGLAVQPDETVLDLTVNRGGHSLALCAGITGGGQLVGIDADSQALREAAGNLRACPCLVTLLEGNFRNLDALLRLAGIGQVDVILADLGLSSQQLDSAGRGFSFSKEEPLGMSFNPQPEPGALSAFDIVNFWQEESLADVIYAYGEEHLARRIAKEIVSARQASPISTTTQLVEVIRRAVPGWYARGKRHPATKTFQALRITVNDELGALRDGLNAAWLRLKSGGRLGVISFHSLEARIVKEFYRARVIEGVGENLSAHAIKPTRTETLQNPRARSAQLRIIKKL